MFLFNDFVNHCQQTINIPVKNVFLWRKTTVAEPLFHLFEFQLLNRWLLNLLPCLGPFALPHRNCLLEFSAQLLKQGEMSFWKTLNLCRLVGIFVFVIYASSMWVRWLWNFCSRSLVIDHALIPVFFVFPLLFSLLTMVVLDVICLLFVLVWLFQNRSLMLNWAFELNFGHFKNVSKVGIWAKHAFGGGTNV